MEAKTWKDTVINIRKSVELPKDRSLLSMIVFADKVAKISFKAGEEEEYKKWTKAFMEAGILIAEADTVEIAIEETKRVGIREGIRRAYEDMKALHRITDYDLETCVEHLEKEYGGTR